MPVTTADAMMSFRSMATDVTLRIADPGPQADVALEQAAAVFGRVEDACTRFNPDSPLMRANAEPNRWHDVPVECAWAIEEAARAHDETGGLFDPRVLDALVDLGYDRSLPFDKGAGRVVVPAADQPQRRLAKSTTIPTLGPWRPRVEHDGDRHRVHLDGARVDLGGIGKGLAVRWAADELRAAGSNALLEAGGDCQLIGEGPSAEGWLVGLEDPRGGTEPLAVFALRDLGCATSSARVRRWVVDGREVHHIIDPRTGLSAGRGLVSVTVIHRDVAWAEVWSKSLFVAGLDTIERVALDRELPAVWVDVAGRVRINDAARQFVVWQAPHA